MAIAGASALEEIVQAVIARLAPSAGVEVVEVTDEVEYFPLPRELRELGAVLGALVTGSAAGDPRVAAPASDPFPRDRSFDAFDLLTDLP